VVSDILRLLDALRDEIPSPLLLQLPEDEKTSSLSNVRGPLEFALKFYGLDIQLPSNKSRPAPRIPFATVFEDVVSLSASFATAITTSIDHRKTFRDLLVHALALLNKLVTATELEGEKKLNVDWNPSDWVSCLVATLETDVSA
jgi:hypothetical protein